MDRKEELKKGCGKIFMYIKYFNDKRVCGQMEDLKHSEHIILCPECEAELKGIEETEKRLNNEWLNKLLPEQLEVSLGQQRKEILEWLEWIIEDKHARYKLPQSYKNLIKK